jgi:hypothetical protein
MSAKFLTTALLAASCGWAQAPSGRWDGSAEYGALKVPFTIHFEGSGNAMRGSLVNGDKRVSSTSGSFEDGMLRLTFDRAKVQAKLDGGQLTGSFVSARRTIPFTATAYCTCGVEGEAGPDVAGTWAVDDAWWRFAIKRAGDDTIVSGLELGPLGGRFDGIAFQLHYFDGVRGALLELEPKDGGMAMVWKVPDAEVKRYRAIKASP